MPGDVVPFRCHRFTKADLEFLADLMARLVTAGLILDYERRTNEEHPHMDAVVISLPGSGSSKLSVERRGDGVYWLMSLEQGRVQALAFGRTVDKVCWQLGWWVREERSMA